jgi:capsular polysaccharide biosynthesis protein
MLEQEIDLRPYFRALLQAWKAIVGVVILAVVAAAVFSLLRPRPAEASAQLLVVPTVSQVNLDARIPTRDTALTNGSLQRQALIDLASSPVMETHVAEELGLNPVAPGSLLAKIDVAATSDLLVFTASDSDPAYATRLVEAWARSYEELVDELYTGTGEQVQQIDEELIAAQARYDETQRALESYLGQGESVAASQEVQRLQSLLNGARDAQNLLYAEYLTRTQELNLLIEDARSVRAQVGSGAPLADTLADLALRSRVAGDVALPVSLQFDSPETLAQAEPVTESDLDALIAVLEAERDRVAALATSLGEAIAAGDGSSVGLSAEQRARYEQDLAVANSRLEAFNAQVRLLTARRDLALDAIRVLQARSSELALAQALPSVNVRYIGSGLLPESSALVSTVVAVVLAATLSFALVSVVVVAAEVLRQVRRASAPTAAERSIERTAPSR